MSSLASACRAVALPNGSSVVHASGLRMRSSRLAAAPLPRRHSGPVRAQEGSGSPPPPQQEQQSADDERRLEALEAAAKARKGVKAGQTDASRGGRPSQASSAGASGMAEWKEGQLFPEGWDEMDPFQKVTELYMGKRGFMYWSGQSALYSVGILMVAWALFRFVGPALGLYKLTNDLSNPNFL